MWVFDQQNRENRLITRHEMTTPMGNVRHYYRDVKNNFEYRRVYGGLAWPSGEMPGFVVVVTEDERLTPELQTRILRVYAEHATNDVPALIRKAHDLEYYYNVQSWYGDNETMMRFVTAFNRSLPKTKQGFYITAAPMVDDAHNLQLYAHQIRERIRPAKKSLYFGDHTMISGAFGVLTDEDVKKKRASEFPAIAALGYVVAAMEESYCDSGLARDLLDQHIASVTVEGL
jgi:hypothetical protein